MKSVSQVVIFTQPGCPTCMQVKSYLKGRGVEYVERDVRADDSALQELQDRGFSATPLTVVGDVEILGMNRARFEAVLGPRSAEVAS